MSTEDTILYEPLDLLADLKAWAQQPAPAVLMPRLPIASIRVLPALFQPRGVEPDEKHIQDLVRGIKLHGALDPLEVIQIGPDAYLVDGHHRLAAYEEAEVADAPVTYFQGTVEEAVLRAGQANSKAKLPMTTKERMDFAWRLTLMGTYSKREVVEASGTSDGQAANMRRVMRELGGDAYECRTWWQARQKAKGKEGNSMTPEERELWVEEQAARVADRLAKEFGSKLSSNLEVAALALNTYFGRRLPGLVSELAAFVPDESGEGDELDDF